MSLPISIFFVVITAIIALILIVFGCILLSDAELVGIAPLLLGVVFTSIPLLIICDFTEPVEKQFAEKQQAVIEAQKELEKFLIDHPELKESE